jgi:hypothetical protein
MQSATTRKTGGMRKTPVRDVNLCWWSFIMLSINIFINLFFRVAGGCLEAYMRVEEATDPTLLI